MPMAERFSFQLFDLWWSGVHGILCALTMVSSIDRYWGSICGPEIVQGLELRCGKPLRQTNVDQLMVTESTGNWANPSGFEMSIVIRRKSDLFTLHEVSLRLAKLHLILITDKIISTLIFT